MKNAHRLNRFATLAIIPLVAVGFYVAMRGAEAERGAPFEPEGTLVVANLRDRSLSFYDFAAGERDDIPLAGPPHEMAIAGDRLYVTLGRENAIAEVDLSSREVVRYLLMPGNPHGIAYNGSDTLYVTLDDADALVLLDAGTLAERERIPTGDTPHALALVGDTAFVTNSRDGTISAIGEQVVTRESGELPESITQVGPAAVAVANAGDGTIAIFSLPGMERVALYVAEGRPVRLLALESFIAVARGRAGDIAFVDPFSGEVEAAVSVGRLADGLCLSPSGRWLAAPANGDNRLSIIDTAALAESTSYETADGPGACTWLPD